MLLLHSKNSLCLYILLYAYIMKYVLRHYKPWLFYIIFKSIQGKCYSYIEERSKNSEQEQSLTWGLMFWGKSFILVLFSLLKLSQCLNSHTKLMDIGGSGNQTTQLCNFNSPKNICVLLIFFCCRSDGAKNYMEILGQPCCDTNFCLKIMQIRLTWLDFYFFYKIMHWSVITKHWGCCHCD